MDDLTISSKSNQSAPSTPRLNVSSRMPHSSLHPKNRPTRTMQINRMINSNYNSSPSRIVYSDRFIPSRSCSNFTLFDISNSPASAKGKEDGSGTYNSLLRAALFGSDTPDKKDSLGLPAGQNIFRYKTETKRSLHLLLTFGLDESVPGISHTPVKAPRKVPRSPYKVLDAPALQDDFYLNLVDWSPNNVLAVRLGSCVYLWNVCGSKVTKLCDLGINDSVCSVGWAQRGTHLAVYLLENIIF